MILLAFSAWTLFVGQEEGHPGSEMLRAGLLVVRI